ncbi:MULTISPECIES: alpha/beta fold hydrolase [Bizionia]|uniref:Alpha/beta hydrolase n=1 Tax=Bizionia algoritergicola TaxID=291187 RepID=A0A5D0QXX9_9FLAO|nr:MULTISPECIES: alpha/beta hydrolase [Bizionia]OBX24021.1 alpha/beta hydrolase [Bizionia sp. APA-3]TYB73531.1 alpha/beta hydrolase [Bizionia algoritergicola]
MKILKALILLTIVITLTSCKKDYLKYTEKPNYVAEPNAKLKPYFDAYDASLKLWDIPVEELYIPTSFGTAHVVVSGPDNGEPLVLLHGMNATSTSWYPNAKALSKDYRLFAIDFILEPGKSLKTGTFDDVEQIVTWYNEIFDQLKLKEFTLVGASRGGWISMKIALYNQKRIKKMVLLSPAQTFIWIRPSADLLKNLITLFSSEEKQIEQGLKSMSSNVANIDKTYLKQYYKSESNDSINKFVLDMRPFSKRDFQSLKMPVLVLIGDDDVINNSKTIQMAKTLIPKGEGEIIENAGHFLTVDQADVVNIKILDFLKADNTK